MFFYGVRGQPRSSAPSPPPTKPKMAKITKSPFVATLPKSKKCYSFSEYVGEMYESSQILLTYAPVSAYFMISVR